jgi:hypothetical protein
MSLGGQMKKQFDIFEKDGARFRRPTGRDVPLVDHVERNGSWVPYEGDRVAPAMFGHFMGTEEHEIAELAKVARRVA